MVIKFKDGDKISGKKYIDVVRKLKEMDSTNPKSIKAYMSCAKERYSKIGVHADDKSAKSFIQSLKKAGVLTIKK